jgi:hypothetical protein
MREREGFEPIDGEEGTHEVDDRVATPETHDGEEKVPEIDSVEGFTPEELEKGSQE